MRARGPCRYVLGQCLQVFSPLLVPSENYGASRGARGARGLAAAASASLAASRCRFSSSTCPSSSACCSSSSRSATRHPALHRSPRRTPLPVPLRDDRRSPSCSATPRSWRFLPTRSTCSSSSPRHARPRARSTCPSCSLHSHRRLHTHTMRDRSIKCSGSHGSCSGTATRA